MTNKLKCNEKADVKPEIMSEFRGIQKAGCQRQYIQELKKQGIAEVRKRKEKK